MVASKGPIENANTKICPSTFVHNYYCMLLASSSTLQQNPFNKPLNLNLGSPNLTVIRDSLASTADKWLRSIHVSASQNPVFSKILSLSSAWSQRFNRVMIQCRDFRSTKCVSSHNFAAILPGGDSVAGLLVANGILNFLNVYNTLLIIRLVLTWFPNSPPAIVSPLSTLCDPYLNIFRGIIPPLGGTLDLSPILAFLVLNAFTSAAAALPAELPKEGSSQPSQSSFTSFTGLTSSQEKWVRRLQGNKSARCSNDAN